MENGSKGKTVLLGVRYNVDLEEMKKQPDLELLEKFCKDGTQSNMCIEYETKNECERRRACLRTWLCKSDYVGKCYMNVRGNKLYIIKEERK